MEMSGLRVVDAKRKLALNITKHDIKAGNRKDKASCAAARCLLRSYDNVKEVRVHISRTYVQRGNRWLRYHTPGNLRSEIIGYDRKGRFSPGDYMLTPMEPSKRRKRKAGAHPHKYTGKKRKPYHMVKNVRTFGWNRKEVA